MQPHDMYADVCEPSHKHTASFMLMYTHMQAHRHTHMEEDCTWVWGQGRGAGAGSGGVHVCVLRERACRVAGPAYTGPVPKGTRRLLLYL